jgi:hypothetical protein
MAPMLNSLRMLKTAAFLNPPNPGAPRRALPQARPQQAKRRGGTNHTSCGRSPLRIDLGERISPARVSDLRKVLFNVEPLSEARTPLADFFSIRC